MCVIDVASDRYHRRVAALSFSSVEKIMQISLADENDSIGHNQIAHHHD